MPRSNQQMDDINIHLKTNFPLSPSNFRSYAMQLFREYLGFNHYFLYLFTWKLHFLYLMHEIFRHENVRF